jgi:hypothetical protein
MRGEALRLADFRALRRSALGRELQTLREVNRDGLIRFVGPGGAPRAGRVVGWRLQRREVEDGGHVTINQGDVLPALFEIERHIVA